MKVKNKSAVAQLCPTLSDPMDCSLPGSSVHGIFQARVLEWGAIAFSNGSLMTGKMHIDRDLQWKLGEMHICIPSSEIPSIKIKFLIKIKQCSFSFISARSVILVLQPDLPTSRFLGFVSDVLIL